MRIWDQMPPSLLCNQHLLAQWREGLGLWSILTNGKQGYRNHPETKRWVGHEDALYAVLVLTRVAMVNRGWNPKPMPLHPRLMEAVVHQTIYGYATFESNGATPAAVGRPACNATFERLQM